MRVAHADDFDADDAAPSAVSGGALQYNPGLRSVTNSVRAGLGSGLDASGLSVLISRSAEFPPPVYAALGGFAAAPAPTRVMQVGSAHTSTAAQVKAMRQARGEAAADAASNMPAAASSQLLHALPLRPVPPGSSGSGAGSGSGALQGQDKPLHRRLVSFAINQNLGGRRDAAGAGANNTSAAAAATAVTSAGIPAAAPDAAAAVPAPSDPSQPPPPPPLREGITHEERGRALDNMISLITTISSLKRWKNKSLQSVDRSLESLRNAAELFMTHTNPLDWGAKISEGLSLSAAPSLAMKQAREARTKIEENEKVIKSIETKVEESIASAGGTPAPAQRHGVAPSAASSSHPSMYLQGDLSCYTTLKYLQRISNSFHLDLLTLVKRFFDTLDQTGPSSGPNQGLGFVGKMSYIHLLLLIHKQLMPQTPATEAVRIVMQDWEQDSRAFGVRVASGPPRGAATASADGSSSAAAGVPTGEIAFSLPAFHSCLFQLVDHWTLGCEVGEYLQMLSQIFSKITQPNPDFNPRPGPQADRRKVVFKPLTVEYARALEAALTGSPEHRSRRRGAAGVGGLAGLMGTQPGFQKGTKSIKGVASSPRPAAASPIGSPRAMLNARRASGTGSIIGSGGSSSSEGSKRNSGVGLGGSSQHAAVSAFLASHGIEASSSPSPSPSHPGGGDSSTGSSAMQTPNRSREGSALAHRGTRQKVAKALAIDTAASAAAEGVVVEYVPSDDEDADHLDVTADGRSRSRTDRVPRPMPETPLASSSATAADTKPAQQHHIVHHPAPESKDSGNLTVVSLGGGLKSPPKPPVVSAATRALLGEMAALINHAAEDVDDTGAPRKHGRGGKKGTRKKGAKHAKSKASAAGKHKRHGSDEGGSASAVAAAAGAAAAGPPELRDLEQRRLTLESESSSMHSPRRVNALRRLESVPFDPLSRFSAAPIVAADGSVNYSLLDPSIAELVKPRIGVQASGTWSSKEEEDALIGAELSPLEGDASRVHSTAAAAVEARRLVREADRRARRAARLAQGRDDLDEFSNSEADSEELLEEEARRIREAELRALEDEELRNPLPLHSKRVDTPSASSVASASSRPSSRDATVSHPALPSFPSASAVMIPGEAATDKPMMDVGEAVAAALREESQTKDKRDARRSASGKDATSAGALNPAEPTASSAIVDAASSNAEPTATSSAAAGSPLTAADRSSASVFAMGLPSLDAAADSTRAKRLSSQRTMGGGFARKKSSLGGNEAAMAAVAGAKKGAAPSSASTTAVEPVAATVTAEPVDSAVTEATTLQSEPKSKRMSSVTEKRLAKRAAAAAAAPLPPVAVPAVAAVSSAPRGSSQSPSRVAAFAGVAENAAWFAHMSSLGRDAILGAALAHAGAVAARAEEDARRAGLELPPEKTGEATVLATDVEVALDASEDQTHAGVTAASDDMLSSEAAPKVTEVVAVAPLRALRATSAGRSRTKLRDRDAGGETTDVNAERTASQSQEQRIADLADSIATRIERAADAKFARPPSFDPSPATDPLAVAPQPKSPMYAPALTVAAPGIVSLAHQSSSPLRSPSLSTHSSRAASRRPSVLLAPGSPVVVSGQEDLRGVLVVEPASLNPSLLSPTATAASAGSPARSPREGNSPVVGPFGTHTAQRRAERLNRDAANNAAATAEREQAETEAAAAHERDALARDLAREGHTKRDSTASSDGEYDFVAAAAAAATSAAGSEQLYDAEVSASAAQGPDPSGSDASSSAADAPVPAEVSKTSDRRRDPAASALTHPPSSAPLPDDWADQLDSFFNKPAAAVAIVEPAPAASAPLTAADLASSAPPTPRGVVVPTALPASSQGGSARGSGQPSPRTATAVDAQNKPSVSFLNSAAATAALSAAAAADGSSAAPTLSESRSSLLSSALVSTREALHALSSYHGPPSGRSGSLSGNHVLPLEVSREILAAIQALKPVESLPLAPTLRPASAAPTKVVTKRGRCGAAPTMPAESTDAASTAVSLHELEDLGLSLESLLSRSRPSGRRTVAVGQVRLLGAVSAAGSSSSANAAAAWRSSGGVGLNPSVQTLAAMEAAQARERAALKRGPDEAHAIISANLREAQALHSARGAPPFGGLDVHAYATTSDKAERAAAGSATGSREASPVRHIGFATTTATPQMTAAAISAGLSPLIGANSFKLPASPRAAGGSRRASSGLAGIQTQATPRSGAASVSAAVVSPSLAAFDSHVNPFTSLSTFAAAAALIPLPVAPRANETVHLSSGEVLLGWQQQEQESAAAQEPQQKQRRVYKRPAMHHDDQEAANKAAVASAAGFDVTAGVNAAFDSAPETAPRAAASTLPSTVDPAAAPSSGSSGVWNHASTLADEFEWHMPSSAARLTQGQGQGRGRRGRHGQQLQQLMDAPIPIRKVAQSASDPVAFSPRSYSRALRMVVDRSRLEQQQLQAAQTAAAEDQARMQQQQQPQQSISPERMVDSLFTADGQIKGWNSSFTPGQEGEAEEKQNTAAPATTTMMMLANGGLQHISLSVAATSTPYSTLSPYLPQPTAASPSASASASAAAVNPTTSASAAVSPAFPHEIHSSKFAALTASFNAHPGASSVFGLHSARPKTAERWQTSREGPVAILHAAAAAGASTARPSTSHHLNPVHAPSRALTHRGGPTGVRTGVHAHAHYSGPSTSHASLMLTPAAPSVLSAREVSPPPPPMRAAAGVGVGAEGWMASGPSVPSIPRSRVDLLSSQTVDSVDPGFKPRNSFVVPQTTTQQQQQQQANHAGSAASGVHADLTSAPKSSGALGSHWHASAVRAIPPPELSRFTYAPPFHALHGTNTPSSGYIHAIPHQLAPPHPQHHTHALGPHESLHAYPTANVYVGSQTARGARPSPSAVTAAAAAAYAASKHGSQSARSRRRYSDDADLTVSSVSPFYPPIANCGPPAGRTLL